MNKRFFFALLVLVSMGIAMTGCKSWAPIQTETGECLEGERHWVEPQQDPQTGEWKEGYCEPLPGRAS